MVKNKKGKKKNKMAGRNRPNPESPAEGGEANLLIIPSDTSENEDRTDLPGRTPQRTPEPDAQVSDSGISSNSSGRGSPGDGTGSSATAGDTKVTVQPQIDEEKDFEDADEDPAPVVDSAEPSPKAEDSAPPEPEPAENMDETPNETKGVESKVEPKTETENEAEKDCEKTDRDRDVKTDEGVRSPTAAVRSKGAVSMKRNKPIEDVKHPLEFPWSFWTLDFDLPWDQALSPIASFDTAEDFWWYFNRLRDPKVLGKGLLMFKKNIRPEWEDPRNFHGGRWNLSDGVYGRAAAGLWQELALMMIGGIKFGDLTPHLNGIYCTWKGNGIHYSIWIDTVEDRIASTIGNIIHEALYSALGASFHMELVPCHSGKGRKRVLRVIN